jgi:5-methylcytosine-specific restriction protein A
MPLPRELNRDHVLSAMRSIRERGVPTTARSTKFDVIDPETGIRYPPKLVLSLAVEAATGQTLSRRDFSGGEQTNKPLRDLGFEIASKEGAGGAPLDP